MSNAKTIEKISFGNIGKLPVVVLPVEEYERMREDLEMYRSLKYKKSVKNAREEIKKGKVYSLAEVKKKLKLA